MSRDRVSVPLKHDGVTIGVAEIDEDGVIHATIDSTYLSDEFKQIFLRGHADGLSIKPTYIPAVSAGPKRKIGPKE